MVRQIPLILGVLAIVGLTVAEARISGRFQSSNVTAEQFTQMLKNVPMNIGDWHGEDLPVDEQVRRTAGARGYVSRDYVNVNTGERVRVWLIVGHSRDVVRHTPNVCYPSQGFKARAPEDSRHTFVFEGQRPADFYTNTFIKEGPTGRYLERVFWSWYKPDDNGEVSWQAPKKVRFEFGNTPALYKLYFSNEMHDVKESTDESPCTKFAELFLPVVDKALTTTGTPAEIPAEPADDELSESASDDTPTDS